MKALSFIFLLVAGVLLAGSESEYFLGNIIGMIILFIAGDKPACWCFVPNVSRLDVLPVISPAGME